MHVPFHCRISFVQARNVLLVVFLLGFLTIGNQIRTDLMEERAETNSTILQIMEMQRQAAAQAAWQFDNMLAERVLAGMLHYSPVLEAKIVNDYGAVLAEKKREGAAGDSRPGWLVNAVIVTNEYSTQLFVPNTEDAIGTLSVRINARLLAATFFQRTRRNILSAMVPLLVLAVVLFMMLYFSLTKPLFRLASRLSTVDTEHPMQSQLHVLPGHQKDELALLVSVTNELLSQFEKLLSNHKKAKQELTAAEKKYRSIFDNAVEGIYQCSFDGRFLTVNPALATILGYENPEQLIEEISNVEQQVYADYERRAEILGQLLRDGFIVNTEIQFRRKDGSLLWGSQNARIVRDETGKPLFIEGMIADITGRKQAMDDLAKVEAQLMQSQKMEALGSLTGGIAHDFNNLLQIISGYVQLLLIRKNQQDPDYSFLYEVNQAAVRASDLIRGLLTFSRKVEKRVIPLNINDVVRDALRLLGRSVPKMISLQTSLADDLADIQADPTQMEQVIMNLANNAVQAMEETGTLTIVTKNFPVETRYINTGIELEAGKYIMLEVSDTGHGMNETTLQRIFEPFFTTKEPGKGTGLGLASAYGIVTNHSGKIICSSEPGAGTTFTIFLPVHSPARGLDIPMAGKPVELIGGSETVLLVDDEEKILKIANDILRQYGYDTRTVFNGEQALEAYKEDPAAIDLIVMDLGMPGMGGRKCLEELLKIDPKVQVVVASGYGGYDIAENPQQYGAAAFVVKPYRLDILIHTVREVLDRNN